MVFVLCFGFSFFLNASHKDEICYSSKIADFVYNDHKLNNLFLNVLDQFGFSDVKNHPLAIHIVSTIKTQFMAQMKVNKIKMTEDLQEKFTKKEIKELFQFTSSDVFQTNQSKIYGPTFIKSLMDFGKNLAEISQSKKEFPQVNLSHIDSDVLRFLKNSSMKRKQKMECQKYTSKYKVGRWEKYKTRKSLKIACQNYCRYNIAFILQKNFSKNDLIELNRLMGIDLYKRFYQLLESYEQNNRINKAIFTLPNSHRS